MRKSPGFAGAGMTQCTPSSSSSSSANIGAGGADVSDVLTAGGGLTGGGFTDRLSFSANVAAAADDADGDGCVAAAVATLLFTSSW